jgi:iron complex transport system permease protein
MRKLQWLLIILLVLIGAITLLTPWGGEAVSWDIMRQIRLPRWLFAVIGGMLLAISALLWQTTLRQPYIDGAMLGVASGAELTQAMLIVLVAPSLHWRVLVGAVMAVLWLIVLRVSILRVIKQPFALVLGGLALAMVLSAGTTLITAQQGLVSMGMSNVTWLDTWLLSLIGLGGMVYLIAYQDRLRYFALPKHQLQQLGISDAQLSIGFQIIAAAYIGAVTAILGTVFFVGIVLVQLVRLRYAIPAGQRIWLTGLLGAVALSVADMLANGLLYPVQLPTQAIFLLLVAPFLLSLLRGRYAI